jgi:hypothetical protein
VLGLSHVQDFFHLMGNSAIQLQAATAAYVAAVTGAGMDPEAARKLQEELAQKRREREEIELERSLDDDVGQSHTDSVEQV